MEDPLTVADLFRGPVALGVQGEGEGVALAVADARQPACLVIVEADQEGDGALAQRETGHLTTGEVGPVGGLGALVGVLGQAREAVVGGDLDHLLDLPPQW